MGSTATIIIDPLPTEWSMTGAGGYCPGTMGSDIGLNWSDAGTNYQLWYRDTIPGDTFATSGVPISGIGGTLDFGFETAVGTYIVIGTNSFGCTDTMVTADTNAVWVNPNPNQYTVSGGGTDCASGLGFDIILNNSDVTNSYLLYGNVTGFVDSVYGSGDTVHFGFQNTTDTFIAIARNTFGCVDTMLGYGVVVSNPLPNPYTISPGGAYCVGDTIPYDISLSSSDTGISYQLLLGGVSEGSPMTGTGSGLDFGFFTDAGTYTITATNMTTGCVNTDEGGGTSATITINLLPNVYSVSGSGQYCFGGARGLTCK